MTVDERDTAAAARELSESVSTHSISVDNLASAFEKSRGRIKFLFVIVLLMIVMLGGLGFVANKARDNAHKAEVAVVVATKSLKTATESLKKANISLEANKITCDANNGSRRGQTDLWDKKILPIVRRDTNESKATLAGLQKDIDKLFKQRICPSN